MVTAETAVVLPVLVLFTLASVAAIMVAQARVRCADLAREAARAASRGSPAAPTGPVQISVSRQGESVSASAVLTLRPVSWLPSVTVTEVATAAAEPDGTGSNGAVPP